MGTDTSYQISAACREATEQEVEEQCGKELLGPRQLSAAVTQSATEEAGFRLDGEIGMILQVPAWLDFEGKGVHPLGLCYL